MHVRPFFILFYDDEYDLLFYPQKQRNIINERLFSLMSYCISLVWDILGNFLTN